MKFQWRFGAAALASALLVSLVGCTSGARPGGNAGSEASTTSTVTAPPDARALYQEMNAKMEPLTSMDANFSMRITILLGESSLVTNMEGTVRAAGLPDKPALTADISTSSMGQSVSMSLYYADNVMYIAAKDAYMDSKIKIPVPTELPENSDDETQEELLAALKEKAALLQEKMLDSAVAIEKNGDTQITLTIPAVDLWHFIEALSSELPEDTFSGDLDLSAQPEMSDLAVTLTMNSERYLTEMLMECEAVAPVQTEESSSVSSGSNTVRVSLSVKLNNPGEPVEIIQPADLDSYQEQSPDDEELWGDEFSDYELL